MNKSNNKKVLSIVAVVVIILAIAGILYMKNKPSTPEVKTPDAVTVTATVRKASFGSVVNVILSEAGKTKYTGATNYQVYYEGKPITQKEVLGTATTAFPARVENDKVTIKLLKVDGKEAYSVDLNLQKEK